MTLIASTPTVDGVPSDDLAEPGPCGKCHDSGWVPIPEDFDYFLHCDCPAGVAESWFSAPALGQSRPVTYRTTGFYPSEDTEPPF